MIGFSWLRAGAARSETGAGSVVALAIILVATLVAVCAVAAVWVHAQRTRVQSAADLVALGAAEALVESLTTSVTVAPCAQAMRLSEANRVWLSQCEVNSDLSVTVTVTAQINVAGLEPHLSATARAGFANSYGMRFKP